MRLRPHASRARRSAHYPRFGGHASHGLDLAASCAARDHLDERRAARRFWVSRDEARRGPHAARGAPARLQAHAGQDSRRAAPDKSRPPRPCRPGLCHLARRRGAYVICLWHAVGVVGREHAGHDDVHAFRATTAAHRPRRGRLPHTNGTQRESLPWAGLRQLLHPAFSMVEELRRQAPPAGP
eukprot:5041354-Prymnesium_polylepis.1